MSPPSSRPCSADSDAENRPQGAAAAAAAAGTRAKSRSRPGSPRKTMLNGTSASRLTIFRRLVGRSKTRLDDETTLPQPSSPFADSAAIWPRVFAMLDIPSLAACMMVCRSWRAMAQNSELWLVQAKKQWLRLADSQSLLASGRRSFRAHENAMTNRIIKV